MRHVGKKIRRLVPFAVAACAVAALSGAGVSAAAVRGTHTKHFTIAYELGYVANNWQTEAENLTLATSRVAPYKNVVTLQVHIAGQNVENQISQVQQEIAAGVNAIILYPLSPTALAPVVNQACARGIKVFTYDAHVNSSCAYQSSIPYTPNLKNAWGASTARWLVGYLHGHGNVVMLSGVPGVSQDTWNVASAKKVFRAHHGIKIVAQVPALWNQAISKTKMSQLLASNPNIDGIWDENGCFGAEEAVLDAHHKPIPCAGNSSNGHRLMMLPKSKGGVGLPSISIGTGVNGGALSLVDAVKALEGKNVPHFVANPVSSQEATNATLRPGKNVVPDKQVGGPGFMWFGHLKAIPNAAETVHAALTGKPSAAGKV